MFLEQVTETKSIISTLEKYISIKEQIDFLTHKLDALKPEIMQMIPDQGKIVINGNSVSLAERKTWSYSKTVEDSEDMLRRLKKIEEIDGTAAVKSTIKYIVVR